MTFPALIALIGILYPFLLGVYYTFTNYMLTEPGNIQWVGLANYIEIFKNPDFWNAFSVTFLFAGSVVIIELVLGLGKIRQPTRFVRPRHGPVTHLPYLFLVCSQGEEALPLGRRESDDPLGIERREEEAS